MPRTPLALLTTVLLALPAACGAPRPTPPPAPTAAPAAPAPPAPADVWTREPGVVVRGDSAAATLPYAGTRLEVVRDDSAGLLVRCVVCPRPVLGRVPRQAVLSAAAARAPAQAAGGTLAEFVLAVRMAAARRDLPALRAAMAPRFVHDLDGRDGIVETMAWWESERYRSLDHLPALLDRGVAALADAPVWVAPPDFAERDGYAGLRAGFRQVRGRWEWAFLVQAGRP